MTKNDFDVYLDEAFDAEILRQLDLDIESFLSDQEPEEDLEVGGYWEDEDLWMEQNETYWNNLHKQY